MNRFTEPVRPERPTPGGRRVMGTGGSIFLITIGAILRFALPAGSPHGLNVHIVGVILILAGVLHLVLPRFAGTRRQPDRLRRWVRPSGSEFNVEPPDSAGPDSFDDRTLADELLRHEDRPLR